jgi:preprotein translocase subunit YajC
MENSIETANVIANNSVAAADSGSWFGLLVYCAVVFGIIYLFMVRPTKKRMAEYQKMLDSLKVGSRVLAGGIYGTIKKINDKSIELEIAKGVVVEVSKNAVAGVESK